jgi:iron-sulfur cluster repair protein YtfE (RIC family)
MDIYQRIKQEHDLQRQLATALADTSGDSPERRRLWTQLKPEAEAHANAEEQTFYAALIARQETQEQARHSISEHEDAAELIDTLEEADMSSGAWLQNFKKLRDELEHHMQEEESEVFAQAREVIDEDEAIQLARDYDERKSAEM